MVPDPERMGSALGCPLLFSRVSVKVFARLGHRSQREGDRRAASESLHRSVEMYAAGGFMAAYGIAELYVLKGRRAVVHNLERYPVRLSAYHVVL